MNVCLRNMIAQNLAEINSKRWKEMNPAFCIHTMNDCLKMILEATPEELPKVVDDIRTFTCTAVHPLAYYEAVESSYIKKKPPVFGQIP